MDEKVEIWARSGNMGYMVLLPSEKALKVHLVSINLRAQRDKPVAFVVWMWAAILREEGYTIKEIARKLGNGATLPGVRKICERYKSIESCKTTLRTGRKPKESMAGLCEGGNERIPNLTGEQSDGITVFRIPPMTSLMLHRCRTGAINLWRWWQSPSVNLIGSCIGRELADE
ncbi:hypothetical protein ANN_02725 [Periplaneta americana]|uniref:Uncharacterized protein n=1 Tax=Periplaneta americana TaxID=6978 RepID=A0ABQ8U0L7_PERAM|nr:hypothetical protein ANN_02725 [Periplaneta americana]